MERATILIVDDEENVRNALRRALRRTEHRLLFADQPDSALEVVRKEPLDIIISDHLMPGMTGLEFLKLAHDRQPGAIRMMLTGHADSETAIKAINQGEIYRFLTKPWDDTELQVTIHVALEKLTLERGNRRLLQELKAHKRLLVMLEEQHPGISGVQRDASGAVLISDDDLEQTGARV